MRLRLAPDPADLDETWSATLAARRAEADDFYAGVAPAATPDEARVMRQAFAGMLWSKQFYHYDVARWLDGDPAGPPPPLERHAGRNARWRHLSNHDVISMPDKWEYPWYAAWDLSFHCVTLARVDPELAKEQLRLITREWYMHANGQLPAYEWDFGDVNPPVHAQAALQVFRADGSRDVDWLKRIFHKMLLGFTWWANTKDIGGDNVFGGGFLGLDNIGPVDRSKPMAPGHVLEQADGTGWMGLFCLNMLEAALVLAEHDRSYEDVAVKFFEHFTHIQRAINERGLWDEADGFYYDQIRRTADDAHWPVRARSMTGFIPLYAVARGDGRVMREMEDFPRRVLDFLRVRPELAKAVNIDLGGDNPSILLALVGLDRLPRLVEHLGDQAEFLSPHGVRALSAAYRGRPFELWEDGRVVATVRLRARGVDDRPVRRQLQLARPGLVPGQRPADHRAPHLPRPRGRRLHARVPARLGPPVHAERDRPRPGLAARSPSSCPGRTGGVPCSAPWSASRPTPRGATTCCSSSTSTATTAPGWARPTRPAGPAWSPT